MPVRGLYTEPTCPGTTGIAGAYDGITRLADMGWVGYAQINFPSATRFLRATSIDMNVTQEIEKPDVVDGRIDKTVYRLGPKLVEGTLSMPVIADNSSGSTALCNADEAALTTAAAGLINDVWCWATSRNDYGRMSLDEVSMDVRYAAHALYTFDYCIINTLSMSVAQQEMVTWDLNIIGRGRDHHETGSEVGPYVGDPALTNSLASPARALTWNDVTVTGWTGCPNTATLFYSNQIREFSFEVNNNADRFFTFNGSLFPIDINVGQREITGSMTLLGLAGALRDRADTNAERFTSQDAIGVALFAGNDTYTGTGFTSRDFTGYTYAAQPSDTAGMIWMTNFTAVVFQLEESSLSNDVYETTVAWHGLASDVTNFTALYPITSPTFPAWGTPVVP